MASDSEIRTAEFMEIYDALTPENRARLAALLRELAHSQEAASDSPPKEPHTTQ